jgi:transposase-like protein
MKNNFSCPNCHSQQKLKHIYFMSNNSVWHCHKCNSVLKPEIMSTYTVQIGFLSVVIPSYYCMLVLKYKLFKTLFIGLMFGVLAYVLILFYYYYTVKLEEV